MKHHGQDVEKFPGDEHRQIYWAARHYPLAVAHAIIFGGIIGFGLGCAMTLIILTIRGIHFN